MFNGLIFLNVILKSFYSILPVRFSIAIFGIFILVHCKLSASQPMGKTRETSNVSHWMLVSISLEIFHDCFKSLDYVPLRNCLQSRTLHFYWLTLDTHDNLDIAPGKNWLNYFYRKYWNIIFKLLMMLHYLLYN